MNPNRKLKRNNILWGVSLMVIGAATLLLIGSRVAGVTLPDLAVRGLGVIELAALPVLAYTTVRKLKWKS